MPFYVNANIRWLDMSGNHLNGTIPDDIQKFLPGISYLNLPSNSLDGVISSSIGDMRELWALDLSDNKFSGEVPKGLFSNLSYLTILKLSKNKLQGQVLSGNLSLGSIEWLHLDSNCFTGKIGNWNISNSDLQRLDIGSNSFRGMIPHWISNMSYLSELVVRNNSFEGQFPCGTTSFRFLDISHNYFSGPLPSCSNFQFIRHLHLGSNRLTGSIPNVFRDLTHILTLDIGNNFLTGRIPEFQSDLSNLRFLILRNNNFSGSIPKQLCQLSDVSLIDLSGNSLSGSIPTCLHNIIKPFYPTFIQEMDETSTEVGYTYESVLLKVPILSSLWVDRVVPEEVQFTTKSLSYLYKGRPLDLMVGLDLSCNKLTGEIPEELGLLNQIHSLNLSHNQLYGPIPVNFSSLANIESLDLSSNHLSGEVPSELTKLNTLEVFNVSYNNLSGRLPDMMKAQFSTFTKESYEGNPLLCGPPLEKKCTAASPPQVTSPSSKEEDDKWCDVDFLASFYGTWVVFMLGFAGVLYVNPYWRRRWLEFVEECMYTCYYFLEDSVCKVSRVFPAKMECWCVSKMKYSLLMMMMIGSVMVSGIEGGCIQEERNALLQIKTSLIDLYGLNVDHFLPSWVDDGRECCDWERVMCNTTTGHVTDLSLSNVMGISDYDPCRKINWPLNVSVFLHFKELTSLKLSRNCLDNGIVKTGLGRLSSLKKLHTLDLSLNSITNATLPSLGALTSLRVLNLRLNRLEGYFPALGMCLKLETLNLGDNEFNESFITSLSALPMLKSLDLRGNWYHPSGMSFPVEGLGRLSSLKKLQTLDLSVNSITNVTFPSLDALTSLRVLNLNDNNLEGYFPALGMCFDFDQVSLLKKLKVLNLRYNDINESFITSLSALPMLKSLDLVRNKLSGTSFPVEAFTSFHHLEVLDLSQNNFVGSIPSTIQELSSLRALSFADNNLNGSLLGLCELKNLHELDLSHNMFNGSVPQCFNRLSSLAMLDISSNRFTGTLTPSPIANLTSLEYVDFSDNKFEGIFSFSSFSGHTKLEVVRFICNSDKFEMEAEEPMGWIPMFQLKVLLLPGCNINRHKESVVPGFLLHQRMLQVIDLSHNSLEGQFPKQLIENNTMLKALVLRNNSFGGTICMPMRRHANLTWLDMSENHMNGTIPVDIQKFFPYLQTLNLSRNSLDGSIPSSVGDLSRLWVLDLSDNKLSGEVPKELFSNISLRLILRLSNNLLHGMVLSGNSSFDDIIWLALDNNCFTGKIGNGTSKEPYMDIMDISNNFFTGTIPRWISNMNKVFEFVARNNSLEGHFPCGITAFSYLDISQNSFSGSIPSCLNFQEINHLHLGSNKFTGSIPDAFRNLTNVYTLDIGNNSLSGRIPEFIGELSSLRILILRKNNFSGSIPKQLCQLSNVSLLDLSTNSLSGSIPSCLHNFIGSFDPVFIGKWLNAYGNSIQYYYQSDLFRLYDSLVGSDIFETQDEVQFTIKTHSRSYKGHLLDLMVGLDLSCNKLVGEIPKELGLLNQIHSLNLSHNQLTGTIPKEFSNLENIESLDLSYNGLSGKVPSELIKLNSLAIFNVSYNNLSGRLPDMKPQFSTFTNDSYEGNPLLCGPPLVKKCTATSSPQVTSPSSKEEDDKWYDIDFLASFYGTWVVFMLGFAGVLYVNPYWRRRWLEFVEECMYTCYYFLEDSLRKVSRVFRSVMVSGIEGGCIQEERNALLQIKTSLIDLYGLNVDHFLPSWVDDGRECCDWERVMCNTTTDHVTDLSLRNVMGIPDYQYYDTYYRINWPLNVSLFLHFKELTSLNLSMNCLDDGIVNTGLGRLSSLKKLEILDLSDNRITNKTLPSLGALTSLRVLNLNYNNLEGYFPALGMSLENLEILDLSTNEVEGFDRVSLLKKLKVLNLGYNDFNESFITSLSALPMLKSLDLTYNYHFGRSFPAKELVHLTNLEELDLTENYFNDTPSIQECTRLSRLKKLKGISLQLNVFNKSIISCLGALPSLKSLDLSFNGLGGSFPIQELSCLSQDLEVLLLSVNEFNGTLSFEALASFHNLEVLDLSENNFVGSIPSTIQELSSLRVLSFAYNNLHGSLRDHGLCELKNLQELDLSDNMFNGSVPQCFNSLSSLTLLDISSNRLTGTLIPSPIANLTSLRYVDFGDNLFEGSFLLSSLSNNSMLEVVRFMSNNSKFEVETEEPTGWIPMFQLKLLVISGCNMNRLKGGIVPGFLLHQHELHEIDLSDNSLVGPFPNWLIESNTMLEYLILSKNSFSGIIRMPFYVNANIRWLDMSGNHLNGTIPDDIQKFLPGIAYLNLSSNSLDGVIPSSIGDISELSALDLSDNKFSGEVPKGLFSNLFGLSILKLSNNRLQGQVLSRNLSLGYITLLHLDNNCFTGKIGNVNISNSRLHRLDIGSNSFRGMIPHWTSNMSYLSELVVRNNSFEGRFPCGTTSFRFLDISHNYFSGPLPSCSNFQFMRHLHLGSNRLTGSIPNVFRNLTRILTLDIGDNFLSGRVPEFHGNLSNLRILILRNNKFSGPIPKQLCQLSDVSLIDLSSNSLSGSIPSCLHNIIKPSYPTFIETMLQQSSGYGYRYESVSIVPSLWVDFEVAEEVQFTTKSLSYLYKGRLLDLMVGLDLSCNKLTGEIPEELGLLNQIHSLNLSHNQLYGPIPVNFSNLANIESLDLSSNHLSGEVPSGLIQLHYLSTFNVSYNNLSGKLPDMKAQFATFSKESYEGNPLLCGPPLEKNCTATSPPQVTSPSSKEEDDKWCDVDFLASFYGTWAVFMLGFAGVLYVNPYWRRRWLEFVEECMYTCYYFLEDSIEILGFFFFNPQIVNWRLDPYLPNNVDTLTNLLEAEKRI
ncbi:hypothetical protein OSB04_006488 [Centaurea solstitialis]|uniref:Uncharacterized protein n=1 Tax=Centaurea solstitialis TaxID=347529 RepID=A0AA38TI04_9ASTR|nr:hypothetical protein OSB04_006488 [Centaurea solstitialis]